jgi:hypothetical protein
MRRLLLVAAVSVALPLAAQQPGTAQGSLTVDGTKTDLLYAYAVDHQPNELTHAKSDTKIILTDKPLPDGTDLQKVDYWFPDGILGVVVCIDRARQVSHVVVQHARGTIDAGYFTEMPSYAFKPKRSDRGTIAGSVSTPKPVAGVSATYQFDVAFLADVK